MPRHLAVMFWGALCREAIRADRRFPARMVAQRTDGLLALALIPCSLSAGAGEILGTCSGTASRRVGSTRRMYPSVAYLLAITPLFGLWVAGPRINLRPLRWLGEISYSLYLFHPVVSALLVRWPDNHPQVQQWPLWVFLLLGTAATVAVSAMVYYAVERPAIRLGARLAKSGLNPTVPEPAETPFETVAP